MMKSKKTIIYSLITLVAIFYLIFYFLRSENNDVVIHIKVLNKESNQPTPNIRATLLELRSPIFAIKKEQHFKDINYTNEMGLVSFIINENNEYVVWIEDIKKAAFSYVDINKGVDNHTLIIEKIE